MNNLGKKLKDLPIFEVFYYFRSNEFTNKGKLIPVIGVIEIDKFGDQINSFGSTPLGNLGDSQMENERFWFDNTEIETDKNPSRLQEFMLNKQVYLRLIQQGLYKNCLINSLYYN